METIISNISLLLNNNAHYFYVPPSAYGWLHPHSLTNTISINEIDALASKGLYPSIYGLYPAVIYAILFGIIRLILTSTFMEPLAVYAMKLNSFSGALPNNNKLIDAFIKEQQTLMYKEAKADKDNSRQGKKKTSKRKINSTDIKTFCSKNNMNVDDVVLYINNISKHKFNQKKIVKFVEALWRLLFYSYFCYLGYSTLFYPTTVEWVQDTHNHWSNWPHQPVNPMILLYYQLELGCYIHQLMWTEVTRSDAKEMIIHHLTTILLITISHLNQFNRVGSSILIIHDSADIFLESGKIFNYISKAEGRKWAQNVCDGFFAIFAVTFFITRLVIFPFWLLNSLFIEGPMQFSGGDFYHGLWPGFWLYLGLMVVLQCLHIFWFYLISKMVYKLLTTGIEKDERSDDEDESFVEDSKNK